MCVFLCKHLNSDYQPVEQIHNPESDDKHPKPYYQ